jgi:hypothetical protein
MRNQFVGLLLWVRAVRERSKGGGHSSHDQRKMASGRLCSMHKGLAEFLIFEGGLKARFWLFWSVGTERGKRQMLAYEKCQIGIGILDVLCDVVRYERKNNAHDIAVMLKNCDSPAARSDPQASQTISSGATPENK